MTNLNQTNSDRKKNLFYKKKKFIFFTELQRMPLFLKEMRKSLDKLGKK